jgi:glycerophosphoryl diester phosphodiesterase
MLAHLILDSLTQTARQKSDSTETYLKQPPHRLTISSIHRAHIKKSHNHALQIKTGSLERASTSPRTKDPMWSMHTTMHILRYLEARNSHLYTDTDLTAICFHPITQKPTQVI